MTSKNILFVTIFPQCCTNSLMIAGVFHVQRNPRVSMFEVYDCPVESQSKHPSDPAPSDPANFSPISLHSLQPSLVATRHQTTHTRRIRSAL